MNGQPKPQDNEAIDRFLLRELVDTYAIAIDQRDAALLRPLFAEDAVVALFNPTEITPVIERHGVDEICDVSASPLSYHQSTHFVGNQLVSVDGTDASGTTYCFAHNITERADGTFSDLHRLIIYKDRFRRREDGRWQFTRREVRRQWSLEQAVERSGRLYDNIPPRS